MAGQDTTGSFSTSSWVGWAIGLASAGTVALLAYLAVRERQPARTQEGSTPEVQELARRR